MCIDLYKMNLVISQGAPNAPTSPPPLPSLRPVRPSPRIHHGHSTHSVCPIFTKSISVTSNLSFLFIVSTVYHQPEQFIILLYLYMKWIFCLFVCSLVCLLCACVATYVLSFIAGPLPSSPHFAIFPRFGAQMTSPNT